MKSRRTHSYSQRRLWSARALAAAAALTAVVYASLRSSPYLTGVPYVPAFLVEPLDRIPTGRHALAAFGLVLIIGWAFRIGRKPWANVSLAAGLIAFSGALEILQGLQPGRSPDWYDFYAAAGGAAAGAIVRSLVRLRSPVATTRA